MHSLNDYKFVFLFTSLNFRNLGALNIPLERSCKYLSSGVLHAPKKFKGRVVKEKRKICSRSGWSKKSQRFLLVHKRFFTFYFHKEKAKECL